MNLGRLKTSPAVAFWTSCRDWLALAGRPAWRELKQSGLDQNMRQPLSEKGTYSPDVVQHLSTGTCCCSNVGGKGRLTVKCHTQVPSTLGAG